MLQIYIYILILLHLLIFNMIIFNFMFTQWVLSLTKQSQPFFRPFLTFLIAEVAHGCSNDCSKSLILR